MDTLAELGDAGSKPILEIDDLTKCEALLGSVSGAFTLQH